LFNKKITIIKVDEVDEISLGKRIVEFINIFYEDQPNECIEISLENLDVVNNRFF
jgi:hypothetical protein